MDLAVRDLWRECSPAFRFLGNNGADAGSRIGGVGESPISMQKWIFDQVFLSIANPIDASCLYAVSFILFWLFLMWLLYRKQIFIRV